MSHMPCHDMRICSWVFNNGKLVSVVIVDERTCREQALRFSSVSRHSQQLHTGSGRHICRFQMLSGRLGVCKYWHRQRSERSEMSERSDIRPWSPIEALLAARLSIKGKIEPWSLNRLNLGVMLCMYKEWCVNTYQSKYWNHSLKTFYLVLPCMQEWENTWKYIHTLDVFCNPLGELCALRCSLKSGFRV